MTASEQSPAMTFGRRLGVLASVHPDRAALVVAHQAGEESVVTFGELERRSNQAARRLAKEGVDEQSVVLVALPNGIAHAVASYAVWKLGACVLTMNSTLPDRERLLVLDSARTSGRELFVVDDGGMWSLPGIGVDELMDAEQLSSEPLPEITPCPGTALATGGSTGRPKILVNPNPHTMTALPPGGRDPFGRRPDATALILGPMYHNMPFQHTHHSLFQGCTVVVLERFDAEIAVRMIERHRVNHIVTSPTQMLRMARLPDLEARDLSSVEALFHSAAVCPPWVKQRWIDLLGPERVIEAFGSSEGVGVTFIRGDEWLARPGSVGRGGDMTEVQVLDDEGAPVPLGEVGNIYLRWRNPPEIFARGGRSNTYWGAPPPATNPDGAVCVGDLGWLDDEGYLYIADRRVDMIVTGGQNVYPAEVEAALSEHPGVLDAVVIGLPDAEWGRRVHAIVVAAPSPPGPEELRAHCKERIAHYKVPKTVEYLEALPRDDVGKIRRSQLVAEREAAS
jgi:bile acid-coenzyme A ligase